MSSEEPARTKTLSAMGTVAASAAAENSHLGHNLAEEHRLAVGTFPGHIGSGKDDHPLFCIEVEVVGDKGAWRQCLFLRWGVLRLLKTRHQIR